MDAIRAQFKTGARLVIIGAGYIGLEVAAVAVQAGLEVRVLELAGRVMGRVVTNTTSDFYANVHRQAGVDLRLNTALPQRFIGDEHLEAVEDTAGQQHAADLVVIGVGVSPQ